MVNRIAAGEVVERPASVVKELIENAIDAGAGRIEIVTAAGGLSLIRVTDDGAGIPADELPLAVERHCTSKLDGGLEAISSLGFRGEALASIGSVARLSVRTRHEGEAHGWEIAVDHGRTSPARPAAIARGTQIEVAELFFNTPARLKFMKTERAESTAVGDMVRQIAMAHPDIGFELANDERPAALFSATGNQLERIGQIIGADFTENAIAIAAERDGHLLEGFAGLPTFTRGNAVRQYFFVNGRAVRDRQLLGALRAAYADVIARDRHAIAALFLTVPAGSVDVNVHPAKAEVRFRDPGLVRGLIVGAIREALATTGLRSASTGAAQLRSLLSAGTAAPAHRPTERMDSWAGPSFAGGFAEEGQQEIETVGVSADIRQEADRGPEVPSAHPLGAARAQLHENYIIAQTADGVVLVDQHAAHERLVYERLKAAIRAGNVPTQMLLVPEIVELSEGEATAILGHAEALSRFGLDIDAFGPAAVAVSAVPAMLDGVDVRGLVRDLVDEIADLGASTLLGERIDAVAGTIACHGSVRSGRRLRPEEMDALLRQMEAEPAAAQCIHGRPTYIELKLADIERLFKRR